MIVVLLVYPKGGVVFEFYFTVKVWDFCVL